MGLWKRGQVYWAYFYVDGIRYQRSTGTANRRQAEQLFQKFKDEANATRHRLVQSNPDMTFGELAARFTGSGCVTARHIYHLKILLPFFADIPVLRLTKSLAEDFRRARKAENPIKDATVNRDLGVLRHVLYWAVDELLIHANPLSRLRMAREPRKPVRVLSVQEEDLLLGAAAPHLRDIIVAALDSGMRRGELLNQLAEHVDLARRVLYVTKSKTAEGEAREIPLTQRLVELLAKRNQHAGLLFTFHGDKIRNLKTGWKNALRRANIRHIPFHGLRHTFNTRLMEAGVLQEIRMALMGHSAGQQVHSRYTHVELPVKREAIARLERWVQHQRQEGANHASTETARDEVSASSPSQERRPETVEKEEPG